MTVTVQQKYELARKRWEDHVSPETLAAEFDITREHASRIANDPVYVPERFREELFRRRDRKPVRPRAAETDGAGHIAAPEMETTSTSSKSTDLP